MIHFTVYIESYKRYSNGVVVTSPRFISKSYFNSKEIGDFMIESSIEINNITDTFVFTDLASMSICVLEEYQNQGIARKMVCHLIDFIKDNYKIRKDKMLFIDADASNGFWDYIGMKPNRFYDRYLYKTEGGGYEKVITFSELVKWCKDKK